MRFSADFKQSQILEAASFYIADDELKEDLRLAPGPQDDNVNSVRRVLSRLVSLPFNGISNGSSASKQLKVSPIRGSLFRPRTTES